MKQYLYQVIYSQNGLYGVRHNFEIIQAGGEEFVFRTITADSRYVVGSLFIKQIGEVNINPSNIPGIIELMIASFLQQITENMTILLSLSIAGDAYEQTKAKFLETESSDQPKPIRRLELQQ